MPIEQAHSVRRPTAEDLRPAHFARRRRAIEFALAIGTPATLIGLWEVAAQSRWIDVLMFPAPSTVLLTGLEMAKSPDFYSDVLISTRRLVLGFAFGAAVGTAVGVATGMFRLAYASLNLTLSALYTVPKLALLPVFLIIFGIGETPQVLMIAVTVFFFMWIETMEAFRGVPDEYLDPIRVYRRSRWLEFRHALWSAALPRVFVGLKVSAAVAVLTMVAVEFLQASNGIGREIWFSWSLFRADKMYVGIVVVALMGVVFTRLVDAWGRFATPWLRSESRPARRARN